MTSRNLDNFRPPAQSLRLLLLCKAFVRLSPNPRPLPPQTVTSYMDDPKTELEIFKMNDDFLILNKLNNLLANVSILSTFNKLLYFLRIFKDLLKPQCRCFETDLKLPRLSPSSHTQRDKKTNGQPALHMLI